MLRLRLFRSNAVNVVLITVLFLLKVEDARSAIVGGGEHARVIRGERKI